MKKLTLILAAASFVIAGSAFAGWADHTVSSNNTSNTTATQHPTMQTVHTSAQAAASNATDAAHASTLAAKTGHPQHVNAAMTKTNQAIESSKALTQSLHAQKAQLVHQASQSGSTTH